MERAPVFRPNFRVCPPLVDSEMGNLKQIVMSGEIVISWLMTVISTMLKYRIYIFPSVFQLAC